MAVKQRMTAITAGRQRRAMVPTKSQAGLGRYVVIERAAIVRSCEKAPPWLDERKAVARSRRHSAADS